MRPTRAKSTPLPKSGASLLLAGGDQEKPFFDVHDTAIFFRERKQVFTHNSSGNARVMRQCGASVSHFVLDKPDTR
jgi:hypothetical protein